MRSKRTRADSSCLWGGGAALKPSARARCAALVLVWGRPYSRALHQREDSLLQRGAVSRHASCRFQRQADCRVRSKRTRASAADRAASPWERGCGCALCAAELGRFASHSTQANGALFSALLGRAGSSSNITLLVSSAMRARGVRSNTKPRASAADEATSLRERGCGCAHCFQAGSRLASCPTQANGALATAPLGCAGLSPNVAVLVSSTRRARRSIEPTSNYERPLRTGPRRFERGCGCASQRCPK